MIGPTRLIAQTIPIWILVITNCLRGKVTVISVSRFLKRACLLQKTQTAELFHLRELQKETETWWRWLKQAGVMRITQRILLVFLIFTSYPAQVLQIISMNVVRYVLSALKALRVQFMVTELTPYSETQNANI